MNGDLISREALKAEFNEKCAGECGVCAYHKWENYESSNAVSHCLLIDNAPTVEPDKELKEKIETYKNAYRIMSDAFESEVKKHTRLKGGTE